MSLGGILGSGFMSGVLVQYGPRVLKGAMREYLGKIKFNDMVDWVTQNKSLWDSLTPGYQKTFQEYGLKLGKMEWFTANWVIDAGRESAPSLASLFVGWPEGHAWLERQVEDIKKNIGVNNA